jgi:hypothetical protein
MRQLGPSMTCRRPWLILKKAKTFKRKRKRKRKKEERREKKTPPTARNFVFTSHNPFALTSPFVSPAVSTHIYPKMKASFKGRYELEKSNAPAAAATVAFNAGDVKLRASLTDATVVNGPSLNGLVLAVEKPGFFIVDYNVPKQVYS